ncbi:hypothetical protein AWZ03_001986 [Drosophila navojoa]|uniref:Uncharacterized protein n=1 Tax=Drosophila navojoa TaxID=7232 RepID=A0A484BRS9_DRONA|nr:uncharacterized protein LOC108654069 [Drosophila navojoa]TDG51526.1 hypothetical protein AWZ03_001986 [Drosophila navojoa]
MYTALLVVCLLLQLGAAPGSADGTPPLPTPSARGHYGHGAVGWYQPDNSGKYRHEPRPYDGGYGDRGQPYANDLRGIFRQAEQQLAASVQEAEENFALGPRDHLRFMIDFNYNGTGWQIIQFEWVRDGDGTAEDQRQFSYVNENRLWDTERQSQSQPAGAYAYEQPQAEPVNEHSGEEQQPQPSYEQSNINTEKDPQKVQSTINEVLEYIQQRIVPNLN